MTVQSMHPIEKAFRDGAPIDEALRRAVRRALLEHKRAGNPICTWRDGKVVWIPPEEIEISDEPASGSPSAPATESHQSRDSAATEPRP